jgi:hypothetical protein
MPGQGNPPTRLSLRDVRAERVWSAMREHTDAIRDVRDVLRLPSLHDLTGECISVAVADLVAKGRVVGAAGAGRIQAVDTTTTPGRAAKAA